MDIDQNSIVNNASIEAYFIEEMEAEKNAVELIEAISENDIVKVATLLNSGKISINYSYKQQITALGAAAFEGNIDIINLLLNHRASIIQCYDGGKDAGWSAIENHKYDAFDLLVKKGLELNRRLLDTYETRLMTAVKNSDLRMVSRLLQLKANPNDTDVVGKTALHYNLAITPYETDDAMIGEMLLAEGCDPNRVDENNLSAHAYIQDDRAYAILSNYELELVDKVALKRMQEREASKKLAEQEKARPKEEQKKTTQKKKKFKAKKYRP